MSGLNFRNTADTLASTIMGSIPWLKETHSQTPCPHSCLFTELSLVSVGMWVTDYNGSRGQTPLNVRENLKQTSSLLATVSVCMISRRVLPSKLKFACLPARNHHGFKTMRWEQYPAHIFPRTICSSQHLHSFHTGCGGGKEMELSTKHTWIELWVCISPLFFS